MHMNTRSSLAFLAVLLVMTLQSSILAALPAVPVPPQNPITEPKRVLGKILFWDEQLSTSNVVSCGTCHIPATAGADNRIARHPGLDNTLNTPDDILGSAGVIKSDAENDFVRDVLFALQPQITTRAANSPINAAFAPSLFWDGRASPQFVDPQTNITLIPAGGALESQAVGPPMSSVEMAHDQMNWPELLLKLRDAQPLALVEQIPADVLAALSDRPTYPELFRRAFGTDAVTAARVAFAIATYQRTLISDQTPFDRFRAGELTALTPQQQQGFQAFINSNCAVCHSVASDQFTDHTFRNIGLRPTAEDLGRQLVTNNPNDRGRFKVPSLRNVGLKRTFMHNGMFTTIPQVIGFYARAPGAPQQFPDNRDPAMLNVNVPPQAAQVITDFLVNALTDPRVAAQAFPFDKPALFVDRPEDRNIILPGGFAGSSTSNPVIIVQSPPLIGSQDFRVGVDAAAPLGGKSAVLGLSSTPPVNGVITPDRFFNPIALSGDSSTGGTGTLHIHLSPGTFAPGQIVFVQWFVEDPASTTGPVVGQALSAPARIQFFCSSLGCPPICTADFDASQIVNVADIFAFLNAWFQGNAAANLDHADGVTIADIFVFLNAWFQGC